MNILGYAYRCVRACEWNELIWGFHWFCIHSLYHLWKCEKHTHTHKHFWSSKRINSLKLTLKISSIFHLKYSFSFAYIFRFSSASWFLFTEIKMMHQFISTKFEFWSKSFELKQFKILSENTHTHAKWKIESWPEKINTRTFSWCCWLRFWYLFCICFTWFVVNAALWLQFHASGQFPFEKIRSLYVNKYVPWGMREKQRETRRWNGNLFESMWDADKLMCSICNILLLSAFNLQLNFIVRNWIIVQQYIHKRRNKQTNIQQIMSRIEIQIKKKTR